jgi:trigger factor
MAQLLERTGNNVKFKVTVPSSDVSVAFTEVFTAVSKNVKIPGFRPGRAPKNVVEKRIGLDYIQGEVRDYLVNKTYQSAVKELELIPVTATITPGAVLEGSEFEYTVEAENYPEVTLPAWGTSSKPSSSRLVIRKSRMRSRICATVRPVTNRSNGPPKRTTF